MATQAATKASDKPLRRVPVQGRSVARVARMLDACAELLDEVGYDGLTTTQLAERAGVAIGSVYQFFPDKRAVVQALTMRNLESYLGRLEARLSGGEFASWWGAVEAAVDEYIAMHRNVPGFRTLQFADIVDQHLLDGGHDTGVIIADHLARLLADRLGAPTGASVRFALAVAVEIVDVLTRKAFRLDPAGDQRVLDECKMILEAYLRDRVPGEPALPA